MAPNQMDTAAVTMAVDHAHRSFPSIHKQQIVKLKLNELKSIHKVKIGSKI